VANPNDETPTLRRRGVAWLSNLALLAVSCVLALGLGELTVRLVRPQQPRDVGLLYRPDSTVGYVRLPDLNRRINAGEGWVTLRTDGDGYRVGTDGRRESATKLLILGDSFMEARAVEFEQSVPGLLQTTLSTDLGRPVTVRNAGVSGYGLDQYRLSGARAFAKEHFDALLVAVYVGNDVTDRERDAFPPLTFAAKPQPRLPRRWSFKNFNASAVLPVMLRLVGVSQLASLVWTSTEWIRPRFGLAEWDFPEDIRRSRAESSRWDVSAHICERIAAMADSNGVHAEFVLIPQYAQMQPDAIDAYARSFGVDPADVDVDQPNRLLLAAMRARGLDVIDALEPLRAAFRGGTSVFGHVDHHLSADGHRVVAGLVAPALRRTLEHAKDSVAVSRTAGTNGSG